METVVVRFTLNGHAVEAAVKPTATLVELLRYELGHTGTKRGCDSGACSSCSVHVDGAVVNSCSVLAVQVQGRDVDTVEGLADGPNLHPLQSAFIENGGFQCGFCTPGMLMAGKQLLDENPAPTDDEVRHAIAGNICRCTGYVKIVDSILAAARKMEKERKA